MRLILDSVHKKCALILAEKRRELSGERQRIGGNIWIFWNLERGNQRQERGFRGRKAGIFDK